MENTTRAWAHVPAFDSKKLLEKLSKPFSPLPFSPVTDTARCPGKLDRGLDLGLKPLFPSPPWLGWF